VVILVIIGRTTTKEKNMSSTPEYRREWYSKNREKALASRKKYRDNNVEKCRVAARKWRNNNPEKVSAYAAKYYDEKRINNEMDEWNNTLRELGYADLI